MIFAEDPELRRTQRDSIGGARDIMCDIFPESRPACVKIGHPVAMSAKWFTTVFC